MPDTARHDVQIPEPLVAAPGPRRRMMLRFLLYPLLLYGTWCAMLGYFQDRLIFPRDMTPAPLKWPPIANTEEWTRDRADGTRGVAWFVPAPRATESSPAPCLVFFHGNAEIIDHQVPIMEGYRRLGCSVLLPEFPGYGRSEGAPGEKTIVDEGLYFLQRLEGDPRVDPRHIFIHGRSIGGGAAAQIAARREPAGLILESTFTSLASFADAYFVPRFLVRHPFRTDQVLENFRAPVLIFHGTHDTIIPVAHGRRLRDLARQSTDMRYVEYDAGHNDFPPRAVEADYWRHIETFLKAHGPAAGGA